MKNNKYLLILLFLCISEWTTAQTASIPFEIRNNNIFINLKVNKAKPLAFIFDKGSIGTLIDSASAAASGVNTTNTIIVNTIGSGGGKGYPMVFDQNVTLSNAMVMDSVNLVLINFSNFRLSTGSKLDGIIGYDILSKYMTKMDFDAKMISFYSDMKRIDTAGFTAIPFEFYKGVLIPRFPVTIKVANGESFTGKVMFDSGNSSALLVSAPFKNFHNLNSKIGKTIAARNRGLNVETNDQRTLINEMSFNGFKFGNMLVDLTVNDLAEKKDGYLGILGLEIIKRFNVILDYKHKKIYMKPNKAFNDQFNIAL